VDIFEGHPNSTNGPALADVTLSTTKRAQTQSQQNEPADAETESLGNGKDDTEDKSRIRFLETDS
jgi:hypothetical protein